ncbi:MAG: flagellum-specific ATP synthase FliI, partial [Sulfurimicrobium sp.]|nr:flagellum-specific ATP synthase FliI [Sulfurimicrobium sp.]
MNLLENWQSHLQNCREIVEDSSPWVATGRLTRATGLVVEAVGLKLAVGSSCVVSMPDGHDVEAEVVGFAGERLLLMPSTDVYGLMPGAKVSPAVSSFPP